MTGDPVTRQILKGIALILFGITLAVTGGGAFGLTVAFIGLLVALLTRGAPPRS